MTGLLTSLNLNDQVVLIVGNTPVAWLRLRKVLASDPDKVIVIAPGILSSSQVAVYEDQQRLNKVQFIDREVTETDLISLGRSSVDHIVDLVFICTNDCNFQTIYDKCRKLRIPVNTVDKPEMCTFTLLSSYADGKFQFGVTTNGQGCRLSNRLKRHISSHLPSNVGEICQNVGNLRRRIQEEDKIAHENGELEDDAEQTCTFNTLISEDTPSLQEQKMRRSRWLSQLVEYYPLETLASISIDDMIDKFRRETRSEQEPNRKKIKLDDINGKKKEGKIYLVGAGPGNTSFLTTGALTAINNADLILADKLVPSQVLDLIPHTTEVFIAKKFPGNAERAQEELLATGLEALKNSKSVVRLKQGDPYIFGRGAEEYNYFKSNGYKPVAIPGITSALAATLAANIPATHREVADQLLICTGTGRKGIMPNLPDWVSTRTTVFLMGLHRISELTKGLFERNWPKQVPCCVIERATCSDQRIIRTTLEHVAAAIEICGSRPPGLLVVGYSCEVIESSITNKHHDKPWIVEEGF